MFKRAVVILFILFISMSGYSYGQEKYDTYLNLLRKWGFDIVYFTDFAINTKLSPNTYGLYMSSDLPQVTLAKKSIIVCDTDFNIKDLLCGNLNVTGSPDNIKTLEGVYKLNIGAYTDGDTSVVLVPRNYFISLDYRLVLEDYLRELSSSSNTASTYRYWKKVNISTTNSIDITKIIDKKLSAILLTTFLGIFLIYFLLDIYRNKHNFIPNIGKILKKIIVLVLAYRYLFLFFGFVLFILYPFVSGFLLNPTGSFSYITLLHKGINILNINTVLSIVKSKNIKSIIEILYICSVCFMFTLYLISFILISYESSVLKRLRIKPLYIIYTCLLSMFVIGIFDMKVSLFIVVPFILLLFWYLYSSDNISTSKFNAKTTYVLSIGLIIVSILLGVLYENYKVAKKSFGYKDLLSSNINYENNFYYIDLGHSTRFNPYYIKNDSLVFLDNILIFHPQYPRIVNASLNEFIEGYPSMVMKSSFTDFIKPIYHNLSLRKVLSTTSPTALFYFDKYSLSNNHEFNLSLTFRCNSSFIGKTIKLKTYNGIDVTTTPAFEYPSCITEEVETVEVPLKLYSLNTSLYVFYIDELNSEDLVEVTLNGKNNVESLNFVDIIFDKEFKFYTNAISNSDTLYVYSGSTEKSYIIDNSNLKYLDLAIFVNDMLDKGLLNAYTIYWRR